MNVTKDSSEPVYLNILSASTELIVHDGAKFVRWAMPLGSITFTDSFLKNDPPLAEELSAGLSVVELYIDEARRTFPYLVETCQQSGVIGLESVAAITAVERGVEQAELDREEDVLLSVDAEDLFRTLARESLQERLFNPGLSAQFAEEIVGACCILVELIRQLGFDRIGLCSQKFSEQLPSQAVEVGSANG